MADRSQPRILVLGIGNILWADEGFGVRAVEAFHRRYRRARKRQRCSMAAPRASISCNSSQEADYLLVFDAIDYGLEPGTLKIVRGRRSAEIHRREEDEPAPDRLSGGAERRRPAGRLSGKAGA